MKIEEERYQEKIISYVEAYYQLTPAYQQKGIRQLHHDFNRKYNRQKLLMKILSAQLSLTEIRKVFPFLVSPYPSFRLFD